MGIESLDDEAREALIEDRNTDNHHRRRRCAWSIVVPWVLSLFLFCTTSFFALRPLLNHCNLGSYEDGFATDFVSSTPKIPRKIIRKRFTNDLLYNSTSQTLYNQPLNPNEIKYTGVSSAAIDTAWRTLLHAQYIALEESETNQIPPSHISPIWYNGERNFMELSVFHNLHCLNEIRLALSPGYEDGHGHETDLFHKGTVHLDHCVDQIRQALMCHADLTPVPMQQIQGLEDTLIGNGEEHTCRDFDAIWQWVEERGKKRRAFGD